jgi:hypothetical protein
MPRGRVQMKTINVLILIMLVGCAPYKQEKNQKHFRIALSNKQIIDACAHEYRMSIGKKSGVWSYVFMRFLPGVGWDHIIEAPVDKVEKVTVINDGFCDE